VKALLEMNVDDFMQEIGASSGSESDDDEADDDDDDNADDDEEEDEEVDEEEDEESGSDDDEEDEEEDEEGEGKGHRDELEELQSKDPEFFKFLQNNNPELLEFEESVGNEEVDEEGKNDAEKKRGVSSPADDGSDDDDGSDEEEEEDEEEAAALAEMAAAGEDDDEEDDDEEDDEGGVGPSASPAAEASGAGAGVAVTLFEVGALEKQLGKEHSLRSLKKLLDMYRSCCALSAGPKDSDGDGNKGGNGGGPKYAIPSAQVFNRVMVGGLQTIHIEFSHHLAAGLAAATAETAVVAAAAAAAETVGVDGVSTAAAAAAVPLVKNPAWRKVEPMALAFFKATLTLLESITEPSLLAFVVKQLKHYTLLMAPFPKVIKSYLKRFLMLWGESSLSADDDDSDDDEGDGGSSSKSSSSKSSSSKNSSKSSTSDRMSCQIAAFFRVRQMALAMPFPCVEECLKGLYLTYARNARFLNDQSLPAVTFMGNCVVELYGVDLQASYQHAFVYIRQLALILRNALVKKTKDSMQALFSWQFLSCLRVWCAVVAAYCPHQELGGTGSVSLAGGDDLSGLVYPLVQIVLGADRLASSPKLVPFRLHLNRLLVQLSSAGQVFIPTATPLLEVLSTPDLHRKPRQATGRQLAASVNGGLLAGAGLQDVLRFNQAPTAAPDPSSKKNKNKKGGGGGSSGGGGGGNGLMTAMQQDSVFGTCVELLVSGTDVYRFNAGFPEYVAPVVSALQKLAKETKVARWRALVKGTIETLSKQALFVTQKRSTLHSLGAGGGAAGGGSGPASRKMCQAGLETFRPKGQPNAGARLAARNSDAAKQRALALASDEVKGKPNAAVGKANSKRAHGAMDKKTKNQKPQPEDEDDDSGEEDEDDDDHGDDDEDDEVEVQKKTKKSKTTQKAEAAKQQQQKTKKYSAVAAPGEVGGEDVVKAGFDWDDDEAD